MWVSRWVLLLFIQVYTLFAVSASREPHANLIPILEIDREIGYPISQRRAVTEALQSIRDDYTTIYTQREEMPSRWQIYCNCEDVPSWMTLYAPRDSELSLKPGFQEKHDRNVIDIV